MITNESTPDNYVLDCLADDVEDLETILQMLNSDTVIGWHKEWGRRFERSEIVESLSRLIRSDLVQVAIPTADGKWLEEAQRKELPPASYDNVWFAMTTRGRLVHSNWKAD